MSGHNNELGRVFLRSLRLLDLDRCEGWPGNFWPSFEGNDDPQKKQVRVRSVEWVFYHLFRIWDTRECNEVSSPNIYGEEA